MERVYLKSVIEKDIPRLDTEIRRRIFSAVENKLSIEAFTFGVPMRGNFHGLWKLRVGDYRVVYRIVNNRVFIVIICHRKEVYKLLAERV